MATSPDITTIEKTECIGNSLITINSNFVNIKNSIGNIRTGIAILNENIQVGENVGIINFIGNGVSVGGADNVATIRIPGSAEQLKVVQLEEQGINTGGGRNNFFILNDGSMRVCGFNNLGELGIGNRAVDRNAAIPRISAFNPPLQTDEGIFKLYTQGTCTYVITTKGRVYGAGSNNNRQLGLPANGNQVNVFTFINVLGETATPISYDNPVFGYTFAPTDPVTELATGSGASSVNVTIYARTQSGKIYVWGNNNFGQAGIGFRVNVITSPRRAGTFLGTARQVRAAGGSQRTTVYVVDTADKLFVCGRNQDGQAGINNSTRLNIESFTEIEGLPTNYRVEDVYVGGNSDQISTWVVLKDGSLWACGLNNSGQVSGAGTAAPAVRPAFARITGSVTGTVRLRDSDIVKKICAHADSNVSTVWALIEDGTAFRAVCWGNDTSGQCGLGSFATIRPVSQNLNWPWLTVNAKVRDIVVAGNGVNKTTLVLDTNNKLWAAGFGTQGLLGRGEVTPTRQNTFREVLFNPALGIPIKIRSTNNDSSFANFLVLLSTGRVLAWGYDAANVGQLGVDIYPSRTPIPSLVQLNQ
jgi:alpha-tubulin suppressor-like RCC1 family protein